MCELERCKRLLQLAQLEGWVNAGLYRHKKYRKRRFQRKRIPVANRGRVGIRRALRREGV